MKIRPWKPGILSDSRTKGPKPWFPALAALLAPAYMKLSLRIRSVRVEGAEILGAEYDAARRGRSRFLVAFRHPGDADPHLAYWFLHLRLPRELGRPRRDFGGRFVAGAEIPLWGGPLVRWALRSAGTVPVRHGSLDRPTLDTLVTSIAEDPRPVALAPEGQVTYHAGTVQSLDEGVARLALWASERLAAAGRPLPVRIVPLAVEYRFTPRARSRLPAFLSRLERRCGLEDGSGLAPRERLDRIWERLVILVEDHYARTYGQAPAPAGSGIRERLERILESSLARLEAFYGRSSPGPDTGGTAGLKARTLAARAAAMDRVFHTPARWEGMSPVERGMARRTAAEAFFLDRHQQLVDLGEYLDPAYAGSEGSETPPDRLIEIAQNLWDLANRLEGGDIASRSRDFRKDVVLRVGAPVDASRREGEGSRAAALRVLSDLRRGFEALADASSQ
ncbi:MAG TPA: 1-acyl-sn-glycerol-3-phosphate acyltransferase [Spirochaetia bacterium]|nr:1-acyl-sn-glycerol-3-phosphate acyltransferase [Spirochaetales bacterium]HRY81002.1 1-acyl-sn-glycerol-3-phosphate acyltransferase [Spirochaetia bacterium]